ncbi:MAG: hypothetical protein SPG64_05715, partial [Candidatus Enteromonas sp.]|nr:hypothetical protein [Candidatus Enteromonas sp.]
MPNKFYKGRFALAGMLLVGMLASCNGPIDSGSSIPSLPDVDSSELVSEDPIESSVDTNPVSEETVESSEVTRYALILQYDQALLSVTGADGNPLAVEYEEGATVSFRVSILNATYGNLSVNVNGTALEAVDGVYSFTMTRKTTVRLTVELITVSLTTDNSNVSLVFVGEDGADLESQTGSFVTGSSVRFRLSSRVTGYTEFHDLTVKLGEETLVPVGGIYSIASLTEDTVLNVTATEHVIGEDFACTNCGHDMKAYAFAAKDNCTVEYIEEKGWKVSAIDKNAGYEFVVNPSILSYYYSKGQTYAKFLFGNGTSFGTREQDGVEGNPVNCSFNAIGYNADLTASTKYAEGFFSGMNVVGGDDDICGPAFNLEADKTDIRFYVNPNDSVGKAVGTSYIYGFTAIDPLGVDAYFQADPGESATYTEGSGWKVTGNHFKLSGNIVAHHLYEGKKTMRITFGPAFDGAIDNAETVRLIINAADANNQTKKLADQTVNSMTPSGRGGHYYMDFDLTDASTDWSKGLEFYSWGLGGQYVAYFTGIEFLDDEVSSEPAKNSYLICDNGETGYYTEGSGWVSTGAHFRINGSVINHYKAAGKKTMRVTFGAGQRLIINASVGGAGTQLF